jgi:hypothetical protein
VKVFFSTLGAAAVFFVVCVIATASQYDLMTPRCKALVDDTQTRLEAAQRMRQYPPTKQLADDIDKRMGQIERDLDYIEHNCKRFG